jgi:hypothetical protein
MSRLQLSRTTGVLFIVFFIVLNVPYCLLIQNFEYDDILRKPTDYVLTQFYYSHSCYEYTPKSGLSLFDKSTSICAP